VFLSFHYIFSPWDDEIKFLPFYVCHEWPALHIVIKRKVLYTYICSFSTIFYAISISDPWLRCGKSIFQPHSDKISQSTAERKLYGSTETTRHESVAQSKMQGWKLWDMYHRHKNVGVETASHGIGGTKMQGWKLWHKLLRTAQTTLCCSYGCIVCCSLLSWRA